MSFVDRRMFRKKVPSFSSKQLLARERVDFPLPTRSTHWRAFFPFADISESDAAFSHQWRCTLYTLGETFDPLEKARGLPEECWYAQMLLDERASDKHWL